MASFDKVEQWLLYMLVVTIPLFGLPKRYPIPEVFRNIPFSILCLALSLALVNCLLSKAKQKAVQFPISPLVKSYVIITIFWVVLCTVIGVITFPYWDNSANEFLRNTKLVQKISQYYPEILENDMLLHLKYANSLIIYAFRDLLIPLLGIPFCLYVLFRNKSVKYIMDTMSKAALFAACAFSLYSLIEIPWLITGNEVCEDILKIINFHLYDPAISHGWWPPLLWKGQLRSYATEPPLFSIEAVFIIPLLWYRVFGLRERKTIIVLIFFTFMLYMTRARTGQLVLFGELFMLIGLSLVGKYQNWKSYILEILVISLLSFSVFMVVGSIGSTTVKGSFDNYVKNDVVSATSLNSRSNAARWGSTVALMRVGIDHPFFGVGTYLHSPYLSEKIPQFAKEDGEIKIWMKGTKGQGFMEVYVPVMNEYFGILAQYGIFGLILFFIPIIWVGMKMVKNRNLLMCNFGMICFIICFLGQLVCLFTNTFVYTFPLSLAVMMELMLSIGKQSI